MNIFDQYLEKIKIIILNLSDKGELILPDTLEGINTELPPKKFNSDISTNVAMVLSKINKKSPMDLADDLAKLIKKRDDFIEEANIVKPGFINLKFKPIFWTNFIKEIIENFKTYGVNTKEKKKNYLIEFVSANPTGPLHAGHARGAVVGDCLARILKLVGFNVTRDYYINGAGNQIDVLIKFIIN
mgnify:CR=1 FL=1